jgi:hypothetical protein
MKLVYIICLLTTLYITSCKLPISTHLFCTNTDLNIGNQIWMTKNLNVDTFRNGDSIPQAKNIEQWIIAAENKLPAWCFYQFDIQFGKKYGKLYNWYAVNDARGLAPKGYHVPSISEWTVLLDFLGGADVAGKSLKSKVGKQIVLFVILNIQRVKVLSVNIVMIASILSLMRRLLMVMAIIVQV